MRDPEKVKAKRKRWERKALSHGYGKWLYRKRKLSHTNSEAFKGALEKILSDCKSLEAARLVASNALAASRQREAELGEWHRQYVINKLEAEQKGKE